MNRIIFRNGSSRGPYDNDTLKRLLSTGDILLTDICQEEPTGRWTRVYRSIRSGPLDDNKYEIARDRKIIAQYSHHELILKVSIDEIYRSDECRVNKSDNWIPVYVILNEDSRNYVIIERKGIHYGPFRSNELENLLSGNIILLRDRCWLEGLTKWVSLSSLLQFLGCEPRYLIHRKDQTYGPYTIGEIKVYSDSGNIQSTDTVAGPGINDSKAELFLKENYRTPKTTAENSADEISQLDDSLSESEILDDDLSIPNDDLLSSADDDLLSDIDDDTLSDIGSSILK